MLWRLTSHYIPVIYLLTPRTLARSLHVQDMLSVPAISTTIDR